MKNDLFNFYVTCAPGIEPILENESRAMGLSIPGGINSRLSPSQIDASEDKGGFQFSGSLETVMKCNLLLRTASRVLIRVGVIHAISFSELRKKVSQLNWEPFLNPGHSVNLRVTCHKSKLYHSDAVAERIIGGINDKFTKNNSTKTLIQDPEGQVIVARFVDDICTISMDSSGELLHRRGYRQAVAKAPLRETLASAMILASHWDMVSPLIDPFCGSGTIPIEAAMLAANIPPGISRKFAFMNWPCYSIETWNNLLLSAKEAIRTNPIVIHGFDRDKGAIESAISNASRAGQKENITFTQQPISSLSAANQPGWIITNPPYGTRISSQKDLRDLYASFGKRIKTDFQNWTVGLLCNDPRLTGNLGIGNPVEKFHFVNGGIPVQFSLYGSNSQKID